MNFFGAITIELILLFTTSRMVTSSFFVLFYRISHSQKIAVMLLSLIFFPGVVIHELAHAFMAGLLHVPVGEMEFTPQLHGDGVKMGSVRIGQTDPLRRFFIGVAPLLIGASLISVITYYLIPFLLTVSLTWIYGGIVAGYAYCMFAITNTMFSSKKDMEGAVGLLGVVAFVIVVLIVAGKVVWLEEVVRLVSSHHDVLNVAIIVSKLLLIPLGINGVLVLSSMFIRKRY